MTNELHSARGLVYWAQLTSPNKYNSYALKLVVDSKVAKELEGLGLKAGKTENKEPLVIEGHEKKKVFVFKKLATSKKDGRALAAPKVLDESKQEINDLLGNGSEVTVLFDTYPYNNKFGSGTGSSIVNVTVNDLIVYEKTVALEAADF